MARRWALAALSLVPALLVPAPSHATDPVRPPDAAARRQSGDDRDEPPRRRYEVAAIGDSLTDARSHGGKYLAYLRRTCPESRFDGYGKGGENVQQMRRRFMRDVLGQPQDPKNPKPSYSHVIVFGGVNDLLRDKAAGRSTDKILRDIDGMYEMARRAGVRVVGITVSPWGGFTRYYNARRAQATRDINRWLLSQWQDGKIEHAVDTWQLLSCGDEERLCKTFEMPWIRDGLHFNEAAHVKLGKALHEGVFADCR